MSVPLHPIRQQCRSLATELSRVYEVPEAESLARQIVELATGVRYPMLLTLSPKDTTIINDKTAQQRIAELLARLLAHEPIQYIVGMVDFCGLSIQVAPGVLIPRPETEYLMQIVGEECSEVHFGSCADVCAGSGAIALALSQMSTVARIEAVEVSAEALVLLRANVERCGVADRVVVREVDLLSATFMPLYDSYTLVVSNPPYIVPSEQSGMAPHVLQSEPHIALFVPEEDPLLFYREILSYYVPRLVQGGRIYFEINPLFDRLLADLATSHLLRVRVLQDQYNRNRYICAEKR